MTPKKTGKTKIVNKKHLDRSHREQRQLKLIIILSSVVLAAILGLVVYGFIDTYVIKPNKVVATVGESKIKVGEYQDQVKYARYNMINQAYTYYQYSQMFGGMGSQYLTISQQMISQLIAPEIIGEEVLTQMIEDRILIEEAEKLGITVTDEEIQESMRDTFGFYPFGTPEPTNTATAVGTPTLSNTQFSILKYTDTPTATATATATPDGWEPTLTPTEAVTETETVGLTEISAVEEVPVSSPTITSTPTITPTPTPYTTQGFAKAIDEYLDNLRLQDVGLKYEDLLDIFRQQILREKVLEAITEDLEPVQDQVWARHMLVSTEEKAIELREKLLDGADWNELVAEENALAEGTITNEDLGWFGPGQMELAFETAAYALEEIGEISEPVQTSFGWHVIQLVGKGPVALDANEFSNLKQTTFNEWLQSQVAAREAEIVRTENWNEFVPSIPEVPDQLIQMIYGTQ